MKRRQLKEIMTAYDHRLTQALITSSQSLSLEEERKLKSLRLLAMGEQDNQDLVRPLSNLLKAFNASPAYWAQLSLFEKMLMVIGHYLGIEKYRLSQQNYSEFFSGSSDDAFVSKAQVIQWLNGLLTQGIQEDPSVSGTYEITPIEIDDVEHLQVILRGAVPFKYSMFITLRNTGLILQESPTHILEGHRHVLKDVVLYIDAKKLKEVFEQYQVLPSIRNFLKKCGFQVIIGGKMCAQVFSQDQDFLTQNDSGLKERLDVDYAFAAVVDQCSGKMVLPLQLKVVTRDDHLMLQLESYYNHPSVQLVGANKKQKTFITETRAPGLEHESNLSLSNMLKLSDFFERLEFFSRYFQRPVATLTEESMKQASEVILARMLKFFDQVITEWDRPADFLEPAELAISTLSSTLNSFLCSLMQEREEPRRSPYPQLRFLGMPMGIQVTDFERALQKLNETLIPSPLMFLPDNPLFRDFAAIYESISSASSDASQALISFDNTISDLPLLDCRVGPSPILLETYARALAQSYMECRVVQISLEGRAWLDKTVSRHTYGNAASQPYLDFFTKNNPYYLLDTMVSNLKTLLSDTACKEHHVAKILELLNVRGADQNLFRKTDGENQEFNRFQIKFFLLPLALQTLLDHHLLLPFAKLQAMQHGWILNGRQGNWRCPDSVKTWRHYMINFRTNDAMGLDWGVAKETTPLQQREQRLADDFNRLFVGGRAADIRQVEEAYRQTTAPGSYT